MQKSYVKSALLFSGLAFVIVFFSSLQQNTVLTSLFRGSIGLLPGALFGIILAYIWYLTVINVNRSSENDSDDDKLEEGKASNEYPDHESGSEQKDEQAKLAADFVKTRLND